MRAQLDYATIRAPIGGRVGFRLADVGNLVGPSGTTGIVTIQQVTPTAVVFTEPERELPALTAALGQGRPDVEALTSDGRQVLAKGSLRLLDNAVDAASGTVRLKAVFANDGSALWPGMSVTTRLTEANAWNDTIVSYRDLAPIRVRDVGRAIAGPEDARQAGWIDGRRGVYPIVFKQPNANVIDVVDRVDAELPRLKEGLPPSIDLWTQSDRTQTIRASVDDVQVTLVITVVLVVAVIFAFLRTLRATVIPSLTVPLAFFGACAAMMALGYTLDNLSLMAPPSPSASWWTTRSWSWKTSSAMSRPA